MQYHHLARVEVIGQLWQPGVVAASLYWMPRDEHDPLTRDTVADWLDTHAGDFQSIDDFSADDHVTGEYLDWTGEESHLTYIDCMYEDLDDVPYADEEPY